MNELHDFMQYTVREVYKTGLEHFERRGTYDTDRASIRDLAAHVLRHSPTRQDKTYVAKMLRQC